jgi:hypothetical protein
LTSDPVIVTILLNAIDVACEKGNICDMMFQFVLYKISEYSF